MSEMNIQSDNNIDVIVDTEEIKNSKPKGFWAKLKDIWNKTIFARKIEENAWKRELMKEVKEESKEDIKKIMKEEYLKKERDKLSGNSKKDNFISKLGNALANEGRNMGSGNSNSKTQDKINMMLGTNRNNNQTKSQPKDLGRLMSGGSGMSMSEKIMGKPMTDKERAKKKKEEEERIKRLLR